MKVVLLAPLPPPAGGIAGWTVRMQTTTLKNGWQVEVVDEKLIGNRQVFGENNKKRIFIEIKRSIGIWMNLNKLLNDKSAKVVHSCIPASTMGMLREYICAIITKIRKRKFIVHYRSTLPNMVKTKLGLFVFRILTNKSDQSIVLNSSSLGFVNKNSKTPANLIPNFIEKSVILDENSKDIAQSIKKVLYVGGVIREKGCYDIIKIAEKFPEIQFRLIGNPENEISNIEKPDNFILLGEKDKEAVKQELKNADVFMFLTYFPGEGFSNALAEAMAYGLPCIVTDWAANRDMIEDKGGIIVPIKDNQAVEDALNDLRSKELRKKQSNWNIRKVEKYYIDEKVTGMYVDTYEGLLDQ